MLGLFACRPDRGVASTNTVDSVGWPPSFGFGRIVSHAEIDSLDNDVSPDGRGLPAGAGSVSEGHQLYAQKCARCHGKSGIEGPYSELVTDVDHPDEKRRDKTIGNYWPYATTVYDYIQRAMPYDSPGTLSPQQAYSITAYLLYRNGIIDAGSTVDSSTLPLVVMPARNLFVEDDRRGGKEIR